MDKELAKNQKNYRLDLLKRRSMIDKYKSAVLTARETPASEFHGDVLGIVKNDLTGMFPLMEDVSNIAEGYRELVNQSKMPGRWPDLGSSFVKGATQTIAEHPTLLALPSMGKAGAQGVGKVLAETFGQEKEMWLRSMLHIPWDKTKFTKDMINKMKKIDSDPYVETGYPQYSPRIGYGKLSKLAKSESKDIAEASQQLLKRYPDLKNERLAYLYAPSTVGTKGPTNAYSALGNFFLDEFGNVYDDYRWYLDPREGYSTKEIWSEMSSIKKHFSEMRKSYPEDNIIESLEKTLRIFPESAESLAKRYGGSYGVRVKNVIDEKKARKILRSLKEGKIKHKLNERYLRKKNKQFLKEVQQYDPYKNDLLFKDLIETE